MSVMAETSQSATGPYVAMADAELALNAWIAAFREALVVKVAGSGGEGGGGDGGVGEGGGPPGLLDLLVLLDLPMSSSRTHTFI